MIDCMIVWTFGQMTSRTHKTFFFCLILENDKTKTNFQIREHPQQHYSLLIHFFFHLVKLGVWCAEHHCFIVFRVSWNSIGVNFLFLHLVEKPRFSVQQKFRLSFIHRKEAFWNVGNSIPQRSCSRVLNNGGKSVH